MQTTSVQMERITRTFSDISDEALKDIEQAQVFDQLGMSSSLDWSVLLSSPRVTIISEAGSGKTYECREEQKRLWSAGEAAFYVELAQLSRGGFREQLSPEEEERFDAWRISQSGTATFFLDSFDELKLTQGSFRSALNCLSKELAKGLDRARIIITTRPIPFDEEEFRQKLPFPQQSREHEEVVEELFADIALGRSRSRSILDHSEGSPIWRRVYLMPLTDEQIRGMARNLGVVNPDELMEAIRRRHAEDFTRRPLDLVELCADWQEYQRIRTHREQLHNNIRIKLKPRTDRRELAELSQDKAEDGASRLALACVLTRKLTLRHSAESDRVVVTESALDPANILCDWQESERKTLLERGLFGIANYGRVRFHHRSVIEFLAAMQLLKQHRSGMTMRELKRLLFAETPQGLQVIKPSMRPTAAWLAEFNPLIFREIVEREPEVLIDFADPESLDVSQRSVVLRTYVERYKPGSWRGMSYPHVQIHRFANKDLAPVVQELWDGGVENPEVRELIVEMIGAGHMSTCADLIFSVALDQYAEYGERSSALKSLSQIGGAHIHDVIQDMLQCPERWPERLLSAGILYLFPAYISIKQLRLLLVRTSEKRLTIGELNWYWPRLIAECSVSIDYLDALREMLTDLVMEDAGTVDSGWRYSTPRQHLVPALAATCNRLVIEGCRSEALFTSSIAAIRFSHDEYLSKKEAATELMEKLRELPDKYRAVLFWVDVHFTQQLHPETDVWSRSYRLLHHAPLELDADRDQQWVQQKLGDTTLPIQERKLALELAMHLLRKRNTDNEQCGLVLSPLVVDNQELSDFLSTHLQPVVRNPEHERWEKQAKKREEQRKRREAKDFASWVTFWREVSISPDLAFSQERRENTAWNLWRAASANGNSEVAGWNRPFIERFFSKDIADRLRLTMMHVWRQDRPTLRCERPDSEKNTYLTRWRVGLAGIYAESEEPGWANKLSLDEAMLVTRFATIELNRLPQWLLDVSCAHPDAVEAVLGKELEAELAEVAKPNAYYQILQHLRRESKEVIKLFVPQLSRWLASLSPLQGGENEFAATERLRAVVTLLLTHGDEAVISQVSNVAENQLTQGLDTPLAPVWLPVLLKISPAQGVQTLIKELEGREYDVDAPGVTWISLLFGDRHRERVFDLSDPGFTPELLLDLVRLAYKHVRPEDDIQHEGTYTPGLRDHAQSGRSYLLDSVLNLGGLDGWNIKQQLAQDPLFAHFRDRALMLAREKAAQEIDNRIYDIGDILDLFKSNEAPPATRDELFEFVRNRFEDLEDALLQDHSPRELWASITDEKIMRREIARELEVKANGIYTVDQESVTADEKETDIRLRVPKHNLQSVVELKLADGRTGRDLRDTLKKQIVMKYMSPENCRAGFLLVTIAKTRTWKHPDTQQNLDVEGLRSMLVDEANRIMSEMSWSIKLAVIVLDLRARLPKEHNQPAAK